SPHQVGLPWVPIEVSSLRPHFGILVKLMASKCLIVFLRAPRLGEVKTRLAASLGAEAALEVYRFLALRTLEAIRAFPTVELRFTPDEVSEVAWWVESVSA